IASIIAIRSPLLVHQSSRPSHVLAPLAPPEPFFRRRRDRHQCNRNHLRCFRLPRSSPRSCVSSPYSSFFRPPRSSELLVTPSQSLRLLFLHREQPSAHNISLEAGESVVTRAGTKRRRRERRDVGG